MKRNYPIARRSKKSRTTYVTKDGRTHLGDDDYRKLTDEIYERDGGQCQMEVCLFEKQGLPRWMPRSLATLDHIKLRKVGGSERDDVASNVRLAHLRCNTARGSKRIRSTDENTGL